MEGQTRTLYRLLSKQLEVCPYGDSHSVGLHDVVTITVISEAVQPDVSGYNTGSGSSYWAADSEGRIYYRPYNGFESSPGWRRDDGVAYFNSPSSRWARDLEGNPLTPHTPAM